MKPVSRNAPCPCGSGKKYKQCHLGKDEAVTAAGVDEAPVRTGGKRALLSLVAVGVISAGLGMSVNSDVGIIALGLGLLGVGAVYVMSDLPPRGGGSGRDPSAINFGGR